MNETNTLIVVVDVQEKLIEGILNREKLLWNIDKLLKVCNILDINTIYSEQNPTRLGSTVKRLIPNENYTNIHKMEFSCYKKIFRSVELTKYENILICGIETHICVQQTCIDFLKNGYKPFIAVDAVSSRKSIDHETSLKRLDSCGAILTTVEAAIFELCRTAKRNEFKIISSLVKEVFQEK